MARTQAADYDQRRTAIVEHAARLYAKHGFLGASVADLAEACEVSKSAIYHYYTSKEDILFDVMHSHVKALEEAANAANAENTGEAKLRDLAHRFMHLYVGAANRHKVLLNELDYLPKAGRDEIVAVQRGLIAIVEQMMREIAPSLAEAKGAPRAAAMLFFGMINWTHTWFDPQGAVSPDALADMAVDMTLSGLGKA